MVRVRVRVKVMLGLGSDLVLEVELVGAALIVTSHWWSR